MGNHHLGSRGYTGKRPVSAKEDAERERQGIPDPLAHDRGKGVPSFDEMMNIALMEVDFDDLTTTV